MKRGLCFCGCGQPTALAKITDNARGDLAGQPRKYRLGHYKRPVRPAFERFWDNVTKTATCWYWTASLNASGYGQIREGSRLRLAHRVAYQLARGPIPARTELDHLCRNRRCVNPDHLEIVTRRDNVYRGASPVAINMRVVEAQQRCLREIADHAGHELRAHLNAQQNVRLVCLTCGTVALTGHLATQAEAAS